MDQIPLLVAVDDLLFELVDELDSDEGLDDCEFSLIFLVVFDEFGLSDHAMEVYDKDYQQRLRILDE